MGNDVLEKGNASKGFWGQTRVKSWKLFLLGAAILIAIALGVGLGVGLTKGGSSSDESSSSPSNITYNNTGTGITNGSLWSPTASTSWQIELAHPLTNITFNASVYDIDLFENNASTISTLHDQGRKVICYFSAGSYEKWRPDAGTFSNKTDLGNPLDGWAGEWWLQTNSTNVRKIMLSRLDMAVAKGCDGVDPDNVDGYANDNGVGLTQADAVNYVNFIADAAHARNLSVGLKNAGEIIPQVLGRMQWAVNEQCIQYEECDKWHPFVEVGKPVFNIEYPDGAPNVAAQKVDSICSNSDAKGFETLLKEMDLNDWAKACPCD